MATVAGSAPLAPILFGATAASAQTEPAHPKEPTAHETERLAAYAAAMRYEDLPPAVLQRAKDCIIDAVATISFGAELPWSKMIIAYTQRYGSGGEAKSAILGTGGLKVNAPAAALANGALGHAFELDATTEPNSGTHPSATLFTSSLAVAQERGLGGRDLLTAFVAGGEAMYRIGYATKHSNETRGFHAPGTTGPFGAAVAVARLRQFDAATMTYTLGIAGSPAASWNSSMPATAPWSSASTSAALPKAACWRQRSPAKGSPGLPRCWRASSASCGSIATSGTFPPLPAGSAPNTTPRTSQ
jgi:2-methylcitrate dehydratase PrpD